jgi:hypothetical protein
MVIINLITLALLAIGSIIYSQIYPKQRINFSTLLYLLCVVLSISIFRNGGYESGDFNIHLYRSISFFDSLTEGNLLPSWAGQLNQTYGYPLFIFNYPLPYYLISLLHLLGASYIGSMKLFLALNIFASGIIMYQVMRRHFNNDLAGFTAAIFYLFAPYHLVDIHFKVVIGEILFFTLLPCGLYFLDQFVKVKKTIEPTLYFGLFFSLLVLSHVTLALFAGILYSLVAILLSFLNQKNAEKILTSTIIGLIIGGMLSIHIWTTPFIMSKYTIFNQLLSPLVYSVSLKDLIFSPYRYGFLFQGPNGEIANLVGYSQILVVIGLILYLTKNKVKNIIKINLFFWLGVFFSLTFLITPFADFFWKEIPLLRNVGNQRLLILVALTTSILAGHLPILFPKRHRLIYLFLLVTVVSTSLNWGQRRVVTSINDAYLIKNLPRSTINGEAHFYANSKWVKKDSMWFRDQPINNLIVTKGDGGVKKLNRSSTEHTYIISANSPLNLRENTLYFPGWTVRVNNKIVPVTYQTDALINFSVPKGLSFIEIKYSDILIYKILKIVSEIGITILIMTLIILRIRRKYKIRRI